MTTVLERPSLAAMTDLELSAAWGAGDLDLPALEAEVARREHAAKTRAASRSRNAEWEAAALANYTAAEAYCRGDGNMLNACGKARGMTAWQLWHGAGDLARRYASDDLLNFWDWQQPRPPGPAAFAAAAREDAAEAQARAAEPSPGMQAAIAAARGGTANAPMQPGSIARYITALSALAASTETTAARIAAANGRNQR